MTNEPSWQLNAGHDDDGNVILEALIECHDSDVAIRVAAADMPAAVSRLSSIIGGISQDAA